VLLHGVAEDLRDRAVRIEPVFVILSTSTQ
jgi:hypothetical protein